MKNIIIYIIALPVGIIASIFLPLYFSKVIHYFIIFDAVTNFFDKNIIGLMYGWIAVGVPSLIVPKRKILFSGIMLLLNIVASFYTLYFENTINYLFIIGSVLSFIIVILYVKNKKLLE